jgi:ATP-binding cassette, subfamily B, multidrug efflux pump
VSSPPAAGSGETASEVRAPAVISGGGMPGQAANTRGTLRRLLGLARPERPLVLLVLLLAIASVALTVTGPKVLGRATDLVFGGVLSKQFPAGTTKPEIIARLQREGQGNIADMIRAMTIHPGHGINFGSLEATIGLALLVYSLAAVLGVAQGRLTATVVQRPMLRLRGQAQDKLSRLPLAYFDSHPRGEILSRVTNDIDNLSQTLRQTLNQLVGSILTIIGVLVWMLLISPLLTVFSLITVPLSMFVTARLAKRARPQFLEQWTATGRLNGHIEDIYTGHAVVKSFGRKDQAVAVFKEQNQGLFKATFRAQLASGVIQPILAFLGNLNFIVVAVAGAVRVATGALTLGDVQAFILYARQITQPMTQVASVTSLLQSSLASAERIFGFLDEPEEAPDTASPAPQAVPAGQRGAVEFCHVSFRYEADKPLIEDLSLRAEPGQTVAIVGHTGAGKTTLVNLLMRFYEIDSGEITVDGLDIAAMRRDDLRARIGMVLQDTWLFDGTIAENLAYGAEHSTREQIVEVARTIQLDHFVRTMPDGYDTPLGEDKGALSSGEKQLITIARAFLADPEILVLDEATSSVDTRTDRLVQEAMRQLRADRTCFLIAHRLSTIRDADLIIVMEAGQIVEQGSHEALLAADGAYHRLYFAQFAGEAEPEEADSPVG